MDKIITITVSFKVAGVIALAFIIIQFITVKCLENYIRTKYDKIIEDYKFDFKVREQATKVAEYMAIARNLKGSSPKEDYRKANQLAWELAMWLPTEVYKKLGQALSKPNEQYNPLSVAIEVRKVLLKNKAGDLSQNDVIQHGPGIGKKQITNQ